MYEETEKDIIFFLVVVLFLKGDWEKKITHLFPESPIEKERPGEGRLEK